MLVKQFLRVAQNNKIRYRLPSKGFLHTYVLAVVHGKSAIVPYLALLLKPTQFSFLPVGCPFTQSMKRICEPSTDMYILSARRSLKPSQVKSFWPFKSPCLKKSFSNDDSIGGRVALSFRHSPKAFIHVCLSLCSL